MIAVSILLAASVSQSGKPYPLMVGDPAPPIRAAEFHRGAPVASFKSGHVYVVEFWATWCVPCKETIPHLTELQKKYRSKATVLGFAIWEPRPQEVAPFVKEWGDKMDYTIARDLVQGLVATTDQDRSRESVQKGFMSKRWMVDSGWDNYGIPCAFLVDQKGRIAWIGDPRELDEPLAKVVAGTYDLDAAAAAYRTDKELDKFAQANRQAAQEAIKANDFAGALKLVEEILARSPKFEDDTIFKFDILLRSMKDPDAAANYMAEVQPKVAWNIPMNMAAIMGHEAKGLTRASALKAIDVCQKTLVQLGKDHTWPLMNIAQLYHRIGDKEKAVEFANRAIKIAVGNDIKRMSDDRDRYAAGGGTLDKP